MLLIPLPPRESSPSSAHCPPRASANTARLALAVLVSAFSVLSPSFVEAQEGTSEILIRGNYWRDRNTRVLAPYATVRKEFPTGTTVETDYLLDAITSASAAAGGGADQPFTELRNEIGARVSQKAGSATIGASYRYSSESDYWSHTAGANLSVDLLQKNLTLTAGYLFGHNQVGQRRGALGYIDAGTLKSHSVAVGASFVLSRVALGEVSYELKVEDGFQSNPYRMVKVSGNPLYEVDPTFRARNALATGVRITALHHRGALRHLTFNPRYVFYIDDWGVRAHAPELRVYTGLGPAELRLVGRYYTQTGADFYRESGDVAEYDVGVPRAHCPATSGCYTGDSKLSPHEAWFLEGRLALNLSFLDRSGSPLGRWLGGAQIAVSAGYYWKTRFAEKQYGNAWIGGVELVLPL